MKTRIMRITMVVVLALGLIGVGAFGQQIYANKKQNDASKVAKQFISQLTEGKPEKSYELMTDTSKTLQTKLQFASSMSNLRTKKPVYGDPDVFAKDGVVYYFQRVNNLPKAKSGKTDGMFSLSMVQEKGAWRVVAATVN